MKMCSYQVCNHSNSLQSEDESSKHLAYIQGLCSNFVICEFFFESKFHDILALWETNLDDSVNSSNFWDYLPLILKKCMVLQFM